MILLRGGIRQWLRHPWQTVLTVVGVALGVGVVTAIDLANESSYRAFTYAAQAVGGKATHQIIGGPSGLPEQVYPKLRIDHAVRPAAPVVEGSMLVPGKNGGNFTLLGIDPFAEKPFRSFSRGFPEGADLRAFFTRPAVMLLSSTAQRLGVRQGDFLAVEAGGKRHSVLLCGLLQPEDALVRQGLDTAAIADIATAQELLGSLGRLSRIDLIVPEGGAGEAYLQKVRSVVPADATVVPAGARVESLDRMTRAFRLNLTALSLLALLVGMFLIYNTITFSVVRRRRLIGLLRAMGVTRVEIFALLCVEALLFGVIGTGTGLLLGRVLGGTLVSFVSRTINDLYFAVHVQSVVPTAATYIKGALLGLGATLAAAVPPAREATSAPPRAVLSRADQEARAKRLVPAAAAAGAALMAAGSLLLLWERGGVGGGFAGLFALIVGYALTVPGMSILLTRLFRPLAAACLGSLGKMAARGIVVSLSRTAVATAALVVAVSATLGIGMMVASFRHTVATWLQNWLRADVYVTTAGTGTGRNKPPLDPDLVAMLTRVPGTAHVTMTRRVSLETPTGGVELLAMEIPRQSFAGYRFKEGRPERAWPAFSTGKAVLVSEPYAYRRHLRTGDSVRLRTAAGEREFPIAGIFYDYGSDLGVVAMSRAAYIRHWGDTSVDGMGFHAGEGVHASTLLASLRSLVAGHRVTVVSNEGLRKESLAVFDRTFAITGVLRGLTVLVAFIGILSALMAIQLERSREFAVMRAIGLTPLQTWTVICSETGLLGMIAGILSLPLGIIQAYVLVYAINRRSFGWTMEVSPSADMMMKALILSIGASLVAGLYPAWRIAGALPAVALKEEE